MSLPVRSARQGKFNQHVLPNLLESVLLLSVPLFLLPFPQWEILTFQEILQGLLDHNSVNGASRKQ